MSSASLPGRGRGRRPSHEEFLMQGVLSKQGAVRWAKYHCFIHGFSFTMQPAHSGDHHNDDHHDPEIPGGHATRRRFSLQHTTVYPLTDIHSVTTVVKAGHKGWHLQVVTRDKTLVLSAPTEAERDEWVSRLTETARAVRAVSLRSSSSEDGSSTPRDSSHSGRDSGLSSRETKKASYSSSRSSDDAFKEEADTPEVSEETLKKQREELHLADEAEKKKGHIFRQHLVTHKPANIVRTRNANSESVIEEGCDKEFLAKHGACLGKEKKKVGMARVRKRSLPNHPSILKDVEFARKHSLGECMPDRKNSLEADELFRGSSGREGVPIVKDSMVESTPERKDSPIGLNDTFERRQTNPVNIENNVCVNTPDEEEDEVSDAEDDEEYDENDEDDCESEEEDEVAELPGAGAFPKMVADFGSLQTRDSLHLLQRDNTFHPSDSLPRNAVDDLKKMLEEH